MTDNEPLRLNVGAGACPIPGYVNLDIKSGTPIWELPYDDGTVDEIRASHVLEHVSYIKTTEVLAHWHAKLKDGGIVKIAVPNLEYIFRKMQTETDENLEGYLFGGHDDEHDVHMAGFTEAKLHAQLRSVGFDCIERFESDFPDCSSKPVSLNMQAEKLTRRKMDDVTACMSMPRLAFTDNCFAALNVVTETGMGIIRTCGAFWGQCLERSFQAAYEQNPKLKWLLAIDYDSVFTTDDLYRLRRAAERSNADAIFAIQCKREANHVMVTASDAEGNIRTAISAEEHRAQVLRAKTGHFGMTLINADKLKTLPKPWFKEEPGPDGGWKDGHTDSDIWFWNQWERAGFTLYQANNVKIGHLQLVVTWPDRRLRPRHQYVNDWSENGKPEYAT